MANRNPRIPSNDWVQARPADGASTAEFNEWAKQNPNRVADAKRTQRSMGKEDSKKEGYRQNASGSNSTVREKRVAKWQGARPVSGKGGAKSPEDKEKKRQTMIEWAKTNPNRRDNAKAAQGKKTSKRPKKAN
jgi:hypothetical protein